MSKSISTLLILIGICVVGGLFFATWALIDFYREAQQSKMGSDAHLIASELIKPERRSLIQFSGKKRILSGSELRQLLALNSTDASKVLIDPWGVPFQITACEDNDYYIIEVASGGKDKNLDGNGDIIARETAKK